MTLLVREAVGGSLRRARMAQSRTLRDVALNANISLGYLSEVERGQKEASSELLFAISLALDLKLSDIFSEVSALFKSQEDFDVDSFVIDNDSKSLLSV